MENRRNILKNFADCGDCRSDVIPQITFHGGDEELIDDVTFHGGDEELIDDVTFHGGE